MKINPKEYNNSKYVNVKACVGAILKKDNKILLTKRNIDPEKGKWCLPGGHIEIGEKAEEAVKRETKEETSLTLSNPKFLFYQDNFVERLKIHSLDIYFTGDFSGEANISNEVSELKWFTEEETKKLDLAFTIKEVLEKYWRKI